MSNSTFDELSRTAVIAIGSSYITFAVIFGPLQLICAYLMWKDKDMQNASFQFMVNLSICDALALVPLGLYAGILLITEGRRIPMLERFMAFIALDTWYVSCTVFIFVAFSRWISMTKPHLTQFIFKKRTMLVLHLLPWVILSAFYFGSVVLHPSEMFAFIPSVFTWGFNLDHPYGEFLHWFNFVYDSSCTLIDLGLNVVSLKWVHETRKSVQTVATLENRRREINLFIQCCIIGIVMATAYIMFTIVFSAHLTHPIAFYVMQLFWIFNHCVNPLVYLGVNRKLRKSFFEMIGLGKLVVVTKVAPTGHINVHSIRTKSELMCSGM